MTSPKIIVPAKENKNVNAASPMKRVRSITAGKACSAEAGAVGVGVGERVKALPQYKFNELDQIDMFPNTLPRYKFKERDQKDLFPKTLRI